MAGDKISAGHKRIVSETLNAAEYNAYALGNLVGDRYGHGDDYLGPRDAEHFAFLRETSAAILFNSIRSLRIAEFVLKTQDHQAGVERDENLDITHQPSETLHGAARMEYLRGVLDELGFTKEVLYSRILDPKELPHQPAQPSRLFAIESDCYISGDAGIDVKLRPHKVYVSNIMRIFQGEEFTVKDMLIINPEIVKAEGQLESDSEGCLSVADIYGMVPRHSKIKVKALDLQGKPVRLTAVGFLARVIQHEVGLSGLPAAEKTKLIDQIFKTLEMRVGTILADQMSEQQLDEFDALMDEAGGVPNPQDPAAAKALKWLESNFPNYRQVVQTEHDKLKAEIKRDASKILEASRDSGSPA